MHIKNMKDYIARGINNHMFYSNFNIHNIHKLNNS